MKSMTIAFLIIGAVLLGTNPTMDEYVSWLQAQTTSPGSFNGALFSLIGSPIVKASTRTANFGLFSVYRTELDSSHAFTTIGLFHHFVPTEVGTEAWTPGQKHPNSPHVIAAEETGKWHPEDGYTWVVPPPNNGDFRVKWIPGRHSSSHPHVVAANEESEWIPEDGYVWVVNPPPPGDFSVRWVVGRPSGLHPQVVTAEAQGRWLPAAGYRWVENVSKEGDFRVTPKIAKVWDPEHATTQEFNEHVRAMEGSLPTCNEDFKNRWGRWHANGWQTESMPSTRACIMRGSNGSYKCDGSGCCSIGPAC